MANNTLLAVVTFPSDVFYPVGVTTVGVFIRKGIPHPKQQNVLWARALQDGLLKSKRKRLPNPRAENDLEEVRGLTKAFIRDPDLSVTTIDQFQRAAPVGHEDSRVELVPEAYLTQRQSTVEEISASLEVSIRNTFAYLVKINRAKLPGGDSPTSPLPQRTASWKRFAAEDIFRLQRGHFHSISDLDPGKFVTISRISDDNGFVGFFDIPEGAEEWPVGTITVSTVTGDAFAQPVPFIATDNVVLLTPKEEFGGFTPASLTFAAQMLSNVKWRYSYGRQCYQGRFAKIEFVMPVTPDGNLDYP